mmetsp:Transcript_2198/g.5028  ORF Transcript_2198/g.5028 Transcript_2198/m.5028 type:complete len:82 (-) Transcript_2198:26-271(-)
MVEHASGKTATGDWQAEFGPAAGHRSFVEICGDFPDNEWCRLHMYDSRSRRWRSGSCLSSRFSHGAVAVALAVLLVINGRG